MFSSPLRWSCGVAMVLCVAASLAAATDSSLLKNLVAQLGSDNPQRRDDARGQLMALQKADLPALRAAALAQSPLLPGQIGQLREIVTQVFLSGEDYRKNAAVPRGFLGLSWEKDVENDPRFEERPFADGIPVHERILGFPAFQVLQTGDSITKVLEQPQTPLHTVNDFIRIIGTMPHGSVVHLGILRSGHSLSVAVTLAWAPIDLDEHRADDAWIDNWILARNQRAEDYWNNEFWALDPHIASTQQTTAVQP
jgi:hypothetical protein